MKKIIFFLISVLLIVNSNGEAVSFSYTKLEVSSGAPTKDTKRVSAGDFNNDGYIDIFCPNGINSSQSNFLFINEGSADPGDFSSYLSLDGGGEERQSTASALADFNNDGWLDAAVSNQNGKDVIYYFRMVGGNLTSNRFELPGSIKKGKGIAVGDLNFDGYFDIVVANTTSGGDSNTIYWNNGDSTFTHEYFGGMKKSVDVALADLNEDGYLDAAIANSGQKIQVFFNNNGLGFTDYLLWESSNDYADNAITSVDLAEIDGDGYIDLVVCAEGYSYDNDFFVYKNNSEEGFIEPPYSHNCTIKYSQTRDIQVSDLDNDGRIDILTANYNSSLINDALDRSIINSSSSGNISFDGCNNISIKSNGSTYGIFCADFNNDGKIDVISGSEQEEDEYIYNYYFLNNDGEVSANTAPEPPANIWFNGNTLHWDAGTDSETNDDFLTYNVRFGTESGTNDVISSVIQVGRGNAGKKLSYNINNLNIESREDYFWSVQTVDNGWKRSAWAEEDTIVGNLAPYIDPELPDVQLNEDELSNSIVLDAHVSDIDDSIDELVWDYDIFPDTTSLQITINESDSNRVTIDPVGYGEENVEFTVTDPWGKYDTDIITVYINDLPQISPPIPNVYVLEDSISDTLDLDDYVIDHDNEFSELEWTGNVLHGGTDLLVSINDTTRAVTFNPAANWNGQKEVIFRVKDDFDDVDTDQIQVHVISVNDPPVFDSIPPIELQEDSYTIVELIGYVDDPDQYDEYTWESEPDSMFSINFINNDLGKATIHVQEDWFGQSTIEFTVTDTANASDSIDVEIIVHPRNDKPVVSDIPPQTIEEDTADTINLNQYVTDADPYDTISWIASEYNTNQLNVTIQDDSLAVIQGVLNWHGYDLIRFTAYDTSNTTDWDTVHVHITPVNDEPILDLPDTLGFDEDTQYNFNLHDYLSDPDIGDEFTFDVFDIDNMEAVTIDSNGVVTIVPQDDWFGQDSLYFTVTDTANETNGDGVIINVNPTNDAPQVSDIPSIIINEEGSDTFNLNNYVYDPDPLDIISWEATDYDTTQITVSIEQDSMATIQGQLNWNGMATVKFTAVDTSSASDWDTVQVTVLSVNDEPILDLPDTMNVDEDTEYNFNLHDYMTDPDIDDEFLFNVFEADYMETVDIDTNGLVTLIPQDDWFGQDSLYFTVTDTANETNGDGVIINVNPINDAPEVNLPDVSMLEDGVSDTLDLDNYVYDVDDIIGDLNWSYAGNQHIDVSINATTHLVTFTPAADWNGEKLITFTASDGDSTTTDTLLVEVIPQNDPPILDSIPDFQVNQNDTLEYMVTATDIDDGDVLTYSDSTDIFNINSSTGLIFYVGHKQDIGTHTFKICVQDNSDAKICQMVSLEVIRVFSKWDITEDGIVNMDDVDLFIDSMGTYHENYDMNDDNKLDVVDLQEIIAHWLYEQ